MCITVFRIQTKVTAGTYVTHKSLFASIFLKCVQMFLYICCSVVTPIVTLSIITTTYNKGLDMVDKAGVGEKKWVSQKDLIMKQTTAITDENDKCSMISCENNTLIRCHFSSEKLFSSLLRIHNIIFLMAKFAVTLELVCRVVCSYVTNQKVISYA